MSRLAALVIGTALLAGCVGTHAATLRGAAVDPADGSLRSTPIRQDFELRPGTYQLQWDPDLACVRRGWRSLASVLTGARAVSRVSRRPRFASDSARVGAFPIDGVDVEGYLVIAPDESKGAGTGYDTVYVDADRDFDLSDEAPHSLSEEDANGERMSDWISVSSRQGPVDGDHADNPIKVSLRLRLADEWILIQLTRAGAWKGKIESKSGEIECASVDANSNGIYGEQAQIEDERMLDLTRGDSFHADINERGSVVVEGHGPHRIALQKVCQVGGKFYCIDVDPIGNQVTIAPYQGDTGSLLVRAGEINGHPAELTYLHVCGDPGAYWIRHPVSEPMELPVGKYGISSCSVRLTGAGSSSCSVSGSLNQIVQIKPDETSLVEIGGDLSMTINPGAKDLYLFPDDSFEIDWSVKIGDKMELSSIGDSPTSPVVKFFDRKGKMLHKTDASYT